MYNTEKVNWRKRQKINIPGMENVTIGDWLEASNADEKVVKMRIRYLWDFRLAILLPTDLGSSQELILERAVKLAMFGWSAEDIFKRLMLTMKEAEAVVKLSDIGKQMILYGAKRITAKELRQGFPETFSRLEQKCGPVGTENTRVLAKSAC